MNDKLKAVLGIALGAASVAVPGLAPAVAVAQQVVTDDHPIDDLKTPETELDVVEAAMKTIENLKGVDLGNEALLRVGVSQVRMGVQTMHAALIDHTDGTPAK